MLNVKYCKRQGSNLPTYQTNEIIYQNKKIWKNKKHMERHKHKCITSTLPHTLLGVGVRICEVQTPPTNKKRHGKPCNPIKEGMLYTFLTVEAYNIEAGSFHRWCFDFSLTYYVTLPNNN